MSRSSLCRAKKLRSGHWLICVKSHPVDVIAEFQIAVEEFTRAENSFEEAEGRLADNRLQEIEKEIARLVDAVATIGISEVLCSTKKQDNK